MADEHTRLPTVNAALFERLGTPLRVQIQPPNLTRVANRVGDAASGAAELGSDQDRRNRDIAAGLNFAAENFVNGFDASHARQALIDIAGVAMAFREYPTSRRLDEMLDRSIHAAARVFGIGSDIMAAGATLSNMVAKEEGDHKLSDIPMPLRTYPEFEGWQIVDGHGRIRADCSAGSTKGKNDQKEAAAFAKMIVDTVNAHARAEHDRQWLLDNMAMLWIEARKKPGGLHDPLTIMLEDVLGNVEGLRGAIGRQHHAEQEECDKTVEDVAMDRALDYVDETPTFDDAEIEQAARDYAGKTGQNMPPERRAKLERHLRKVLGALRGRKMSPDFELELSRVCVEETNGFIIAETPVPASPSAKPESIDVAFAKSVLASLKDAESPHPDADRLAKTETELKALRELIEAHQVILARLAVKESSP